MRNEKDMLHKYPRLFKMAPPLYIIFRGVRSFLQNLKYLLRNFRYITFIHPKPNIRQEHRKITSKIKSLKNEQGWPISYNTSLFLYNFVRTKQPNLVLETGVSTGYSTRIILEAMNVNKRGKLYSVEISYNVGELLGDIDRSKWKLVVGKPREGLTDALRTLDNIDVFVHDSDHSKGNMLFEFEESIKKIASGGFIMSDDINENNAFLEFCKNLRKIDPRVKLKIIPGFGHSFGYIQIPDIKKVNQQSL